MSKGKGRKPTHSLEILRATTVLAHSTLEDYLRSLLNWKLPSQNSEKISQIPLVGTTEIGRATKFSLGDLVGHRNKTVDVLIGESITEYLGTVSFNNTNDIASALKRISLSITGEMEKTFPILDEMIKRRHNIVHRADRDDKTGSGHHKIKSISVQQIEKWKKSIDKLVIEINRHLLK